MEEHADEELVVVEPDTIRYPRAVMVHLEDASVALGAVMASVLLGLVAPLAYAHAAELLLLDRDLQTHSREAI